MDGRKLKFRAETYLGPAGPQCTDSSCRPVTLCNLGPSKLHVCVIFSTAIERRRAASLVLTHFGDGSLA